jgi:hypothetical protein
MKPKIVLVCRVNTRFVPVPIENGTATAPENAGSYYARYSVNGKRIAKPLGAHLATALREVAKLKIAYESEKRGKADEADMALLGGNVGKLTKEERQLSRRERKLRKEEERLRNYAVKEALLQMLRVREFLERLRNNYVDARDNYSPSPGEKPREFYAGGVEALDWALDMFSVKPNLPRITVTINVS